MAVLTVGSLPSPISLSPKIGSGTAPVISFGEYSILGLDILLNPFFADPMSARPSSMVYTRLTFPLLR